MVVLVESSKSATHSSSPASSARIRGDKNMVGAYKLSQPSCGHNAECMPHNKVRCGCGCLVRTGGCAHTTQPASESGAASRCLLQLRGGGQRKGKGGSGGRVGKGGGRGGRRGRGGKDSDEQGHAVAKTEDSDIIASKVGSETVGGSERIISNDCRAVPIVDMEKPIQWTDTPIPWSQINDNRRTLKKWKDVPRVDDCSEISWRRSLERSGMQGMQTGARGGTRGSPGGRPLIFDAALDEYDALLVKEKERLAADGIQHNNLQGAVGAAALKKFLAGAGGGGRVEVAPPIAGAAAAASCRFQGVSMDSVSEMMSGLAISDNRSSSGGGGGVVGGGGVTRGEGGRWVRVLRGGGGLGSTTSMSWRV